MNFNDFNFDDRVIDGLHSMGYSKPTPVQEQAIPFILSNKDVIACAQTGTGKTAAYILPILNKIIHTETRHLNTLVLVPTRELVQQIDQLIEGLAYFSGISSIPVYGGGDGAAWDQQKKALEAGVDIIIATPGRLIALLAAGTLKLDHLQHLVLDEADRMLDMGFYDDINRIVRYLPAKRQTLLFSATMPPKIRALANKILISPHELNLAIAKPADGIQQLAYLVHETQKLPLTKWLLAQNEYPSVIIFGSTKEKVKSLAVELKNAKVNVKAFHSDLEQAERDQILREFKSRQLPVLVGTDILSRGIDVEGINLVINYDVPPDAENYVHRIGRTARAENTGTSITFISEKDRGKFSSIEKLIRKSVDKIELPQEIGAGPVFQSEKKHVHRNGKKRFFRKSFNKSARSTGHGGKSGRSN